ncbi:MAG: hypothetical protein HLUCCA01_00050 [Bacteroidetes bacterium HLUCCA01]|nr:MAG: hypothetical protein HLUCCA01_00050 [Bacteroidetes bacterium HLUCCA01]
MNSSPSADASQNERYTSQLWELIDLIDQINELDPEAAYTLSKRLCNILGPDYNKGLTALIQEHGLARTD